MGVPHPIPYQGSKRGLAPAIIGYIPAGAGRLIEPFAGSGAVSLAASYYRKAQTFVLNDINQPLINLWNEIIHGPGHLADAYEALWHDQQGHERQYYDLVRARFNETKRTDYFLYLLARCVKASVRYNTNGEFNQSPDNRRKGAHPGTMRSHILGASRLFKGRTALMCGDYQEALAAATASDVVYMDPPYQGVCRDRDPRYIAGLSFDAFVESLRDLNARSISYIVSYDGRTGMKALGSRLPSFLDLTHLEVDAGRSSQATLLGRNANTIESLYLAPALVVRLGQVSLPYTKRPKNEVPLYQAPLWTDTSIQSSSSSA